MWKYSTPERVVVLLGTQSLQTGSGFQGHTAVTQFHPLRQFAPARPILLHPLHIDTISSWPFSEACVYRWRCLVFH